LAELPARGGPGQEEDLETLRDRREQIAASADAALDGDPSAEQAEQLEDTLRVCERVLRRRQALRES